MPINNPQAKSPVTRRFKWSGGADVVKTKDADGKEIEEVVGGKVSYYDKEDEQDHEVPFPFRFLVLDEVHTIGGFSDADKSSFWANEVRDLKEPLTVKTSAGVKARGLYADLGDVKASGAKYAKSAYIAYYDEAGELAIGNIKIMGAALRAWIEFNKKFDTSKVAVELTGADGPHKKGKTLYFIPVFNGLNIKEATLDAAKELNRQLQEYLNAYFAFTPNEEPVDDTEWNKATPSANAKTDVEIEDLTDKPTTKPAEPGEVKDVEF